MIIEWDVPIDMDDGVQLQDLYIDHDGLIARHDYTPGDPRRHPRRPTTSAATKNSTGACFPRIAKCCPAVRTIAPTPGSIRSPS
jgi:hypothetical protein